LSVTNLSQIEMMYGFLTHLSASIPRLDRLLARLTLMVFGRMEFGMAIRSPEKNTALAAGAKLRLNVVTAG
jgi:hypothetical protein